MKLPPECKFLHSWYKPCPWVRACKECGRTEEKYSYGAMGVWTRCSFEEYRNGDKEYAKLALGRLRSRLTTLVYFRKGKK